MRCVAITGAAGRIGRSIRAGLRERHALRLLDLAAQEPAGAHETVMRVDVANVNAVEKAIAGSDAVLHLAAIPEEAPFEELVEPNFVAPYAVFEGARRAGVARVLFASSNHVTGFYPRDVTTSVDDQLRPDTFYGVSKAYGELLGRMYHDKWGLEVACLRIGAFRERPTSISQLSLWLSPRDCLQLVERCLEIPHLGYTIVYGISANDRSWWSDEAAKRIGYEPRDNAEVFAAEIEADGPEFEEGSRAARLQGADFIDVDPTQPDAV